MSFKIASQLSENQIESDVASFLGYITPIWSKRFRLISVNEQTTGADKLFNRFIPIYLQFKVSEGLNPNTIIPKQFLNKPHSNIISYRKLNNLQGNPILCFKLRAKAVTALDFQHNILSKLHKPPFQFAQYVAPLTLSLSEYEEFLRASLIDRYFTHNPFVHRDFEVFDTLVNKDFYFQLIPFLRGHISIPPHKAVNTNEHHYSFSQSGGDVAWHGGEILNDDYRLSIQWTRILSGLSYDERFGIDSDTYYSFIKDFINANFRGMEEYLNRDSDSYLQSVISFARLLKQTYSIKLMLLTKE